MERLAAEIERLKAADRHRTLALANGRDFTSNDYLGLSRHRELRRAAVAAMEANGIVGAGGSRLLRGHHPLHAELEARAAAFFGYPSALYFSSGFLANFALFSTLCGRRDAVIFDEYVHASIKEGLHAAPAERYRARHNDPNAFEDALQRARENGAQELWIAVESVYSMDGDLAPLDALYDLARRYEATLIVDEAHATGIFGARGRGLGESLPQEGLISVHTGGKALGVAGALICGSETVIDYLINKARPFIYSTAPPPMLAAALIRALELIDEEPWRRETLRARTAFAAEALQRAVGDCVRFAGSPIIPVILGKDSRALAVARALQDSGFDVRAIRPPTVPERTARLRIAFNAEHSEGDILALAAQLGAAMAAP